MVSVPPPQGMSEVDYETIEAAVNETVRGRWFLNEFARRNRTAEMNQLLDAMGRLEHVVSAGPAALPPADPSIRLLMQRIKEVACQLDGLSGEMRSAGVDERFALAVEKEARAVSGMLRGPARPLNAPSQLDLPATQHLVAPQSVPQQPDLPQPVAPQSVSEQPGLPQPVAPQSVSEQPDFPQPVAPQSVSEQLGVPQVFPPQPVSQQSVPSQSDASRRATTSHLTPLARAQARARAALDGAAVRDPRLAALSRLDVLPLVEKLAVFS